MKLADKIREIRMVYERRGHNMVEKKLADHWTEPLHMTSYSVLLLAEVTLRTMPGGLDIEEE
ncbi:MAG: hypothetical protein ABII06_04675 [Pseudomonadota bacterium]